jgi:hypothetical protein
MWGSHFSSRSKGLASGSAGDRSLVNTYGKQPQL